MSHFNLSHILSDKNTHIAVDYRSFDQNIERGDEDCKCEDADEDEYIDMEVNSFTHFLPTQNHREFEFHMSSNNVEKESITSPADELFYKGKLLPLHLPPRLEMFEKLLQDPTPLSHIGKMRDFYSTPLGTNTSTTPFQSCNISPAESCQVSRELNPEEYFRDFADHGNVIKSSGSDYNGKKSWSKRLRTKIKSLFGKSGCSYESSASFSAVKGKNEQSNKQNKGNEGGNNTKQGKICHRRSFSCAFKRRTLSNSTSFNVSNTYSCSSSSTSSSSSSWNGSGNANNGINDVQFLKRSSSASSEMETSLIQGAIAHCKQSKPPFLTRKTMSEVGVHSLSSLNFDQTRLNGVCRG